jgi:hypothetical protein
MPILRFILIAVLSSLSIIGCNGQEEKFDGSVLWSVTNPKIGKTSYILGTCHMIDSSQLTFPVNMIKGMIDGSQYIWVEVSKSQSGRFVYLMQENMIADSTAPKLPGCLTSEYQVKLNRIIDSSKFLLPGIKPNIHLLKPQALVVLLEQELFVKKIPNGGLPNFFMDSYFEEYAKETEKGILSFETASQQVQWLMQPNLSFSEAVKKLEACIDLFYVPGLDVWETYRSQNIAQISAIFDNQDWHISRNQNMARRLDISLQSYALFVMVGAAHLGGENGILNLLDQEGYIIKPVEIEFSR